MIAASIYGRAGTDAVERTTKTGSRMATCPVAVDVTAHNAPEPSTLWISVVAFGETAAALLRVSKGQGLSAIGQLTRSTYVAQDGAERENWSLLADSVVTAASARPGAADGRRRRPPPRSGPAAARGGAPSEGAEGEADAPPPFDDAIPF